MLSTPPFRRASIRPCREILKPPLEVVVMTEGIYKPPVKKGEKDGIIEE